MKWIRNLVGQGRACCPPSVADLFSILLACGGEGGRGRGGGAEEEEGGRRKRPNDEEKWGRHVRWQAATSNQEARMKTVAVETRDRVNEAIVGGASGGSMRECVFVDD